MPEAEDQQFTPTWNGYITVQDAPTIGQRLHISAESKNRTRFRTLIGELARIAVMAFGKEEAKAMFVEAADRFDEARNRPSRTTWQ